MTRKASPPGWPPESLVPLPAAIAAEHERAATVHNAALNLVPEGPGPWLDRAQRVVRERRHRLRTMLARHHPFDVLSHAQLMHLTFIATDETEFEDEGTQIVVHLAETLRGMAGTNARHVPLTLEAAREISDHARLDVALYETTWFEERSAGLAPDSPRFAALQFAVRERWHGTTEYDWVLRRRLQELLSQQPASAAFHEHFGCGIEDALRGVDSFQARVTKLLNIAPPPPDAASFDEVLARIVDGCPSVRLAYSCTPQELAETAGLSPAIVEAFLAPLTQRLAASATAPPTLFECPVLEYEGRVLMLSTTSVIRALLPHVEEHLKRGNGFQSFLRQRTRYSEARTQALLETLLKPDAAYSNVLYDVDGETAELDHLMVLDDTIVVAETKAGSRPRSARRGSARFGRHADDTMFAGIRQTKRAARALREPLPARVRTAAGKPIHLDRPRRIIRVVISLESLDTLAPHSLLRRPRRTARVPSQLLCLSLHDLELMSDLFERPAEFLHYVRQRSRALASGPLYAFEELDLLLFYLRSSLVVETFRGIDRDAVLFVPNQVPLYPQWEIRRMVDDDSAPDPRRIESPPFRSLLDALEIARPRGWTELSGALLELTDEWRDRLARGVRVARRRTARTGRESVLHLLFREDPMRWGITVVVSRGPISHDRMVDLLRRRAADVPLGRWYVLSVAPGTDGLEPVIAWADPVLYGRRVHRPAR